MRSVIRLCTALIALSSAAACVDFEGDSDIELDLADGEAEDSTLEYDPIFGAENRMGYPSALWAPAAAGNFQAGTRGPGQISLIVIHTMQGSYSGSISWFQNPSSGVSANYMVRSSDGQITQMVDDSDYSYHALCRLEESIAIEHEGFVEDPGTWYTTAMYENSARISAWAALNYAVPVDRQHIIGHSEMPCTDHTDPGAGWDWNRYMNLVSMYAVRENGATLTAQDTPVELDSGEAVFVNLDLTNTGNYTWTSDAVFVGTANPSPFFERGWVSDTRPASIVFPTPSGELGRFRFPIVAPTVAETTDFVETFQLVDAEGNWFGPEMTMNVRVLGGGDGGGGDGGMGGGGGEGSDGGGCSIAAGTRSHAPGWLALIALALLALRRRR